MIRNSRKILLTLSAVTLIVAGFGLLTENALAQNSPISSLEGNSIIQSVAAATLPPIIVVLAVAQSILVGVMSFAGWLLDQAWVANTTLNPANMPVVQEGWRIMRDIVNALFLLIILWIAFTIIFNIETYGGRKLLVRVIVVALLINFSLAMVTVVFGFTNTVAKVFADQIKSDDVAGIIVSATKIHTVMNKLNTADAQQLARQNTEAERQAAEIKFLEENRSGPGAAGYNWGVGDTVLAAIGVKKADAQLLGGIVGCGIFLMLGPAGCVAGGLAGAVVDTLAGTSSYFFGEAFKLATTLGLSTLLLLFTTGAFLLGAIALLVRLLAEILLSILAPAAFALQMIPNKGVSKYWDEWLNYLLRWAFFAPMFYFLFYMMLFMLQAYDKAALAAGRNPATVASIDFDRILQIVVAFGFIYAAVKLSRKTGGVVAETAIDWGKKLGMAGVGFAGRMAMPAIGTAATGLQKGIAGIETPALRRMLALPMKGAIRVAEKSRGIAKEAEKGIGDMTSQEIKRALGAGVFFTPTERMAAIRRLAQDKELGADKDTKGYTEKEQTKLVREAIDNIKATGGEYLSLLRTNPNLVRAGDVSLGATAEEIEKTREKARQALGIATDAPLDENLAARVALLIKMRPEHIDKNFDVSSLKDDDTKAMALLSWRGEHWGALGRVNPGAVKEINDYLNTKDAQGAPEVANLLIPQMDPGQYNFFATALARAIGMALPEPHEKPLLVLQEEAARSATALRGLIEEFERLGRIGARPQQLTRAHDRIKQSEAKYDEWVDKVALRVPVPPKPTIPAPPSPPRGTAST